MVVNNLGRKRGDSVLDETISIVEVNRSRHGVDNLNGLFVGALETVRDGSGVDTLGH